MLNIADVLLETLESWEEKLVCLTSDSGNNVVSAAKQLEWTRLSCFGHNLHNAVNSSIKDDVRVSRATRICKKIVGTFSHCWKKQRELQSELSLPMQTLVTVNTTTTCIVLLYTCYWVCSLD